MAPIGAPEGAGGSDGTNRPNWQVVELIDAVRRRRMVRSFGDRSVAPSMVDELLADALRAPTAGHARGAVWLVLQGPEQTTTYWEHTTTSDWRATSKRWPGLSRAPVVILSLASPAAYVERYGEPDKVEAGLGPVSAPDGNVVDGALPTGGGEGAWPVPYWFGDAAFATMTLLLAATDAGLGACFLGNFRGEESLLGAFDVPNTWRLFGTVLLGHPDGGDHRSPSLDRPGPPLSARIHRATWNADVGS